MMGDALLGALVGSFATAIGGYVLWTGERIMRVRSLCRGLATELDVTWAGHRNNSKSLIEIPAGRIWKVKYPIVTDCFAIYRANAADLGELRDDTLMTDVISIYDGLIRYHDTVQAYSNEVKEVDGRAPTVSSDPATVHYQSRKDLNNLCNFTASIKNDFTALSLKVPQVIKRLRDHSDIL